VQLNTHRDEEALEVNERSDGTSYGPRARLVIKAKRGKGAGRFAHVPLNRVESIAAIGHMSDTQALTGCQQVVQSLRQQGAQRYLKRISSNIEIAAFSGARMKINSVAANANRVRECLGRSAPARASTPRGSPRHDGPAT
jgi:hypothetical protein